MFDINIQQRQMVHRITHTIH